MKEENEDQSQVANLGFGPRQSDSAPILLITYNLMVMGQVPTMVQFWLHPSRTKHVVPTVGAEGNATSFKSGLGMWQETTFDLTQ